MELYQLSSLLVSQSEALALSALPIEMNIHIIANLIYFQRNQIQISN